MEGCEFDTGQAFYDDFLFWGAELVIDMLGFVFALPSTVWFIERRLSDQRWPITCDL